MKRLFVFAILLGITHYGFSQVGLKAGLNQSTNIYSKEVVYFDSKEINKYRTGYYIGTYTTVGINKKLALQPELLLSLRGSNVISERWGSNVERRLDLYYLNLPFLVSYKPISKFSFVAGPEIGFLLKATSKDENQKRIVYSDFNKIDLGAAVGVNYRFMTAFSAELRYTHGFTLIADVEQATNRTFQLGMAYQLNKKQNPL